MKTRTYMHIVHVVGNRPQFIKLAPFVRATAGLPIRNTVVHSGQHYDRTMSDVFFNDFNLCRPQYNLQAGPGTHGVQTGRMLQKLDHILLRERPNVVVVYGDTNTTLAGALAGYKLHIPVAHVEAGMREWIWRPEEINKKMADHCADFCFCPLREAAANLRNEGIPCNRIFFTGDITYDAFLWTVQQVRAGKGSAVRGLPETYALATVHRAEVVDVRERLRGVVNGLVAMQRSIPILFPMHPRTRARLQQFGFLTRLLRAPHMRITEPMGYFDFVHAFLGASMILTDSGGVQKEAYYARKPCLIFDKTTEYTLLNTIGASVLAGWDTDEIVKQFHAIRRATYTIRPRQQVFGNGHAAENMIAILRERVLR